MKNVSLKLNQIFLNTKLLKTKCFNSCKSKHLFSSLNASPNNTEFQKKPVTVSITGASGNIGYAIAFRIAAGDMLGADQPINLKLIDIPASENRMIGVKLELEDCSFPVLNSVTTHTSVSTGFKDADFAMIIGIANTVKGGERVDGLKANAKIMVENGKAINENASRNIKVLTVGNPVNTNCLIMAHNAPNIPKENFNAMSRLDHNRAIHKLADMFKVHVSKVEQVFIWGNHDATMYPELEYGTIDGKRIKELVSEEFLHKEFVDFVSQRWKEIIAYRCLTSCASAANSAIDHVRDWNSGTNRWISMGVYTDGTQYGIPKDLYFSLPCTTSKGGQINVNDNLKLNEFTKEKLRLTIESLVNEKKMVESFL